MLERLNLPNPDAGQEIIIDVDSTNEFDEVARELATSPSNMKPKDFIYTLPFNLYSLDKEDRSL